MLSHPYLLLPLRRLTRAIGLSLIPVLLLAGCERPGESDEVSGTESTAETGLAHAARHLDPTYVCPMHPDVVRDEPASCPVCGMDLVARDPAGGGETALEHAAKHLDPTYVCPMHPDVVRDEPASCPICGMDLVERELDVGDDERPAVALGPAVIQNMGVRTVKVEKGTLWKYIRTQGKVAYDDDRIIQVHPRTAGLDREPLRAHGRRAGRAQGRSRRLRFPRRAPGPAGLHLRARGTESSIPSAAMSAAAARGSSGSGPVSTCCASSGFRAWTSWVSSAAWSPSRSSRSPRPRAAS